MNLLVLTYHYFHRDKPAGIKTEDFPFSIRLDDFNDHMDEIRASGYGMVDPTHLADRDQYEGKNDRQLLITIDDGHASVEDAADIIVGHNLKPVLNVVPGLVGTANYMDWPALRNLALNGFSIQSHSMNHQNLTRLSQAELEADLQNAKKTIEQNIGLPVVMLAAPMGRIDDRVAKTALDTGYEIIMTSFTGINRAGSDLQYLKRFQVKSHRRALRLNDYFRASSGVRMSGAAKNLAKRIRDKLL